jgi:Carboxypeptidase regulatory-like domain
MRALTVAILLVFGAFLGVAQSGRGTVDGAVFDRLGHKVAGAPVEAKNMVTGATSTEASNEQGVYTLSLPAGTYEITVSVGELKSIQQGVIVTPERPLHGIDVVLALP